MKTKIALALCLIFLLGLGAYLGFHRAPDLPPFSSGESLCTEVEVERGKVALENDRGSLRLSAGEKGLASGLNAPGAIQEATQPKASLPIQKPTPPSAPQYGSITGKLLTEDGQPLEGGEAIFLREGEGILQGFVQRGCMREGEPYAVSAASGEYRKERLEPGEYTLAFRRAGMAFHGYDKPVKVKPGETVRVPDQRLERGGIISGSVVENLSGKPIPGVKVTAGIVSSNKHNGAILKMHRAISAWSDEDGSFRLDMLLPYETYRLKAEHPRYITATVEAIPVDTGNAVRIVLNRGGAVEGRITMATDSSPVEAARVVAILEGKVDREVLSATEGRFRIEGLRAGQYLFKAQAGRYVTRDTDAPRREISIGRDAEPIELALVAGGVIELTVLDGASGQPVVGAEARLDNPKWRGPLPSKAEPQTTDEQGRAVWRGLEPVETGYRIAAAGYGPAQAGWDARLKAGPDEEPARRTIRLEPGRSIAGHVQDETGTPVAGARVRVWQYYDEYSEPLYFDVRPSVLSEADGSFQLDDLPPRCRADILATKEGFAPGKESKAAAGRRDLTFTLHPGATLGGKVVDEKGRPAPGAKVVLEFSEPLDSLGRWLAGDSVQTDGEGRWMVQDLEEGIYSVYARKDAAYSPKTKGLSLGWAEQTDDIVLVLKPGLRVAGRAVNRTTQEGIEGVRLLLWKEPSTRVDMEFKADTAADGAFEFAGVPAGAWSLRVHKAPEDYIVTEWQAAAQFTLEREAVEDLVVELRPGATVRGKVVLPSGEGTEAELAVWNLDAIPLNLTNQKPFTSAGDGAFERKGLMIAAGYRLCARKKGYGAAFSEPFDLIEGQVLEGVTVQLVPSGRVSGTIRDDQGKPIVENYYVKAELGGRGSYLPWNFEPRGEPNEQGQYRMEDIAQGSAKLNLFEVRKIGALSSHGICQSREVDIIAGRETTGVDFVVPSSGPLKGYIAGRVVDKKGKGVEGIQVEARLISRGGKQGEGSAGGARSGKNGAFRIEPLVEGSFWISVRPEAGLYDVYSEAIDIQLTSPVDDAEILVLRVGSISGRVVRKGSGEPVRKFKIAMFTGRFLPSMQSFDDAKGRFELGRVIPGGGTLKLEVEGVGIFEKRMEVGDGEKLEDVLFEIGEPRGIRGRVVRKLDRQPVAGATVTPISLNRVERWIDHISFGSAGASVTDGDGRFEVKGLGAGYETIYIEHPGYGLVERSGIQVPDEGMAEEVAIELEQPGAVEGRVYLEGKPVRGAKVVLAGPPNTLPADTDDAGHYRFSIIPPGYYVVTWYRDESKYEGNPSRRIVVESGKTSVADFGVEGTTLFGQVTQAGQAVAGVQVRVAQSVYDTLAAVVTDSAGFYRLEAIPEGEYSMVLVRNGKPVHSQAIELDGQGEREMNFTLTSASISGRVTEGATGKPVARAAVKIHEDLPAIGPLMHSGYEAETQTGADGRYTLDSLPATGFSVEATHPDYGSRSLAVALRDGENRSGVDFALSGGGTLRLKMKDALSGETLAGSVTFHDESGRLVTPGASEGWGQPSEMRFEGLPPGTLEVYGQAWGSENQHYGSASRRVEIRPGLETQLELPFLPGWRVVVRVVDVNGNIVTGARMSLIDSSGGERFGDKNRPHAGYGYVVLEEGEYRLTVEAEGYQTHGETMVIDPEQIMKEKIVTLLRDLR